ncbi:MAG: hypothetical protein KGO96_02000 [Elusimicrobia bacterium]|nr:hypothetical protein [Elusimicrobiota bacterium]MDE2424668.1 hypothetical protein [Elusimicrobiota bacterium]
MRAGRIGGLLAAGLAGALAGVPLSAEIGDLGAAKPPVEMLRLFDKLERWLEAKNAPAEEPGACSTVDATPRGPQDFVFIYVPDRELVEGVDWGKILRQLRRADGLDLNDERGRPQVCFEYGLKPAVMGHVNGDYRWNVLVALTHGNLSKQGVTLAGGSQKGRAVLSWAAIRRQTVRVAAAESVGRGRSWKQALLVFVKKRIMTNFALHELVHALGGTHGHGDDRGLMSRVVTTEMGRRYLPLDKAEQPVFICSVRKTLRYPRPCR